jgi:hypothetical protein
MKLYIANVGVNTKDASKRGIRSPIFPDKTFEFIPIKERQEDSEFTHNKYSTLKCYNNPELRLRLSHYIGNKKYSNYAVHNDPEFDTFTYGDICTPRASNLKDVKPNDIILFLARLYEYKKDKKGAGFTDNKGNFYFIGYFTIEKNKVFNNWKIDRYSEEFDKWKDNAHIIKFKNGRMEKFRILKGIPEKSFRFKKALKIDLKMDYKIVEYVFCGSYDKSNNSIIPFNKKRKETKLSKFHSKTRSIQEYLDSRVPREKECMEKLLEEIKKHCL